MVSVVQQENWAKDLPRIDIRLYGLIYNILSQIYSVSAPLAKRPLANICLLFWQETMLCWCLQANLDLVEPKAIKGQGHTQALVAPPLSVSSNSSQQGEGHPANIQSHSHS